jgi:hypothetical protein
VTLIALALNLGDHHDWEAEHLPDLVEGGALGVKAVDHQNRPKATIGKGAVTLIKSP